MGGNTSLPSKTTRLWSKGQGFIAEEVQHFKQVFKGFSNEDMVYRLAFSPGDNSGGPYE